MPSIKVNINSKASSLRTSTTFTEVFARFFLRSWHLINANSNKCDLDWVEMNESKNTYISRKEISKEFQLAINEMLNFYDDIYGEGNDANGRWTRENIERHILTVIYLSHKESLRALAKAIKTK